MLFKKWTASCLAIGLIMGYGWSAPVNSEPAISPFSGGLVEALSKNIPVVSNHNEPVMMQTLEEDPEIRQNQSRPGASEDTSVLRGSVTTLKVTRGRSQIIKFAQPIMRISIADPTLADVIPLAPDQVMLNGRQRGVTSLIVWDENGQEGIFDLYVQNDTSELMAAIESIAPNENIDVRVTDDSFVVSGQVSSSVILDEIRRVAGAYGYRENNFVDLTETPIPQVVLEVKIVQMNKQTARDLKTSFATQGQDFTVTRLANPIDEQLIGAFGVSQQNPRSTQGLAPGTFLNPLGAVLGPLGVQFSRDRSVHLIQGGNNVGGATATADFGNVFQTALDFLETEGKVSILAEPKLVSTHGRTADFLAGGEFPYVSGTDQNGSPILSFREFGVSLEFTPWVNVRSGLIELQISPEVSSIDTANCIATVGGQTCGILRRTTNTTVQLHDGESLMISGILTREENNTFTQLPFIADLPVIGAFFKNAEYRKLNTELVVIVTPHVLTKKDVGTYFEKASR